MKRKGDEKRIMMYLVFFILGVLIGQLGLMAFARYKLGYDGWNMVNMFADAWLRGEVEKQGADDEEDGE